MFKVIDKKRLLWILIAFLIGFFLKFIIENLVCKNVCPLVEGIPEGDKKFDPREASGNLATAGDVSYQSTGGFNPRGNMSGAVQNEGIQILANRMKAEEEERAAAAEAAAEAEAAAAAEAEAAARIQAPLHERAAVQMPASNSTDAHLRRMDLEQLVRERRKAEAEAAEEAETESLNFRVVERKIKEIKLLKRQLAEYERYEARVKKGLDVEDSYHEDQRTDLEAALVTMMKRKSAPPPKGWTHTDEDQLEYGLGAKALQFLQDGEPYEVHMRYTEPLGHRALSEMHVRHVQRERAKKARGEAPRARAVAILGQLPGATAVSAYFAASSERQAEEEAERQRAEAAAEMARMDTAQHNAGPINFSDPPALPWLEDLQSKVAEGTARRGDMAFFARDVRLYLRKHRGKNVQDIPHYVSTADIPFLSSCNIEYLQGCMIAIPLAGNEHVKLFDKVELTRSSQPIQADVIGIISEVGRSAPKRPRAVMLQRMGAGAGEYNWVYLKRRDHTDNTYATWLLRTDHLLKMYENIVNGR